MHVALQLEDLFVNPGKTLFITIFPLHIFTNAKSPNYGLVSSILMVTLKINV